MIQPTLQQATVPGEFLGVTEEFAAGPGTYEDKDGRIYSDALGQKVEDNAGHMVSVKPSKLIRQLAPGDLVYARVDDLYESMALLRFEAVTNPGISATGCGSAFLRISELDNAYVERLQDYVRIGDLVRARILEVKNLGTYLTLKAPDLGVVRAYCTADRSEMAFSGSSFKCSVCNRTEQRKIPGAASTAGNREGPRYREDRGGRDGGHGGRSSSFGSGPRRDSDSRRNFHSRGER